MQSLVVWNKNWDAMLHRQKTHFAESNPFYQSETGLTVGGKATMPIFFHPLAEIRAGRRVYSR
jgi:hypothetical protein